MCSLCCVAGVWGGLAWVNPSVYSLSELNNEGAAAALIFQDLIRPKSAGTSPFSRRKQELRTVGAEVGNRGGTSRQAVTGSLTPDLQAVFSLSSAAD